MYFRICCVIYYYDYNINGYNTLISVIVQEIEVGSYTGIYSDNETYSVIYLTVS